MLKSVLIANRGEIARRVIRTAKQLGVRTIAVYSDADENALHVLEADDAIHIGPAAARESYLDGAKILSAAKQSRAEAIHPGYGFLSENADFAQAVIDAGLIWIGPKPDSIRAMGLKDAAKKLMAEAGVPVTPGYLGDDQGEERLQKEADAIGYPVLIKAVAGGGGKGMRKVEKKGDFKAALASAKREAASSFGDDRVLLETYVQRPRHIEVQIFGDTHGNVVHLYERDCSLQRRHQKVIEEAPAPGMSAAARKAVTDAAIRAAKAVNYVGAGTVEFIADASEGLKPDRIWFMEMNTRLQVEHPVTEEITGQDLVEWQLRVASGEELPLAQDEIEIDGHAIEARLYAENTEGGFLPSIGKLDWFEMPDDARVDAAVTAGDEITPNYDPMIAKIITHAASREHAIDALVQACSEVQVFPVKTNASFLVRCLEDAAFRQGDVDTGLIASRGETLTTPAPLNDDIIERAARRLFETAGAANVSSGNRERRKTEALSPWRKLEGFRTNSTPQAKVYLRHQGEKVVARPGRVNWAVWGPLQDGRVVVFDRGEPYVFELDSGEHPDGEASAGDGAVFSPMPGKIVSVAAKSGAKVKKGDALLVLEAMKMEHTLVAPFDGKLSQLNAKPGAQVNEGALLAKVDIE